MALNTTGPISLAGTTTGQSIEIELGGSGTTQISLNDANVRTLAGVASGAIIMPTNFYGASSATSYTYLNFDSTYGLYVRYNGSFYVDSSGNTYASGTLYSNNYGFVTKVNSSGTIQWSLSFNIGSITNNAMSLIVDGSGNGYLLFNNYAANPIIMKISSSGTILWSYYISLANQSGTSMNASGMVINSSGYIDIFINGPTVFGNVLCWWTTIDSSGTLQGTAYMINNPGHSVAGQQSTPAYDGTYYYWTVSNNSLTTLWKFNRSNLSGVFVTQINNYSGDVGQTVFDSSGNIYSLTYLVIASTPQISLIKYNSSGAVTNCVATSYVSGTYGVYTPFSLAIDSSNNLYVSYTATNNNIGGPGNSVIILSKFNSSLSLQWQRQIAPLPYTSLSTNASFSNTMQSAQRVMTDSTGNYFYLFGTLNAAYFLNKTTNDYNNFPRGYWVFKLPVDGSFGGDTFVINNVPFLYSTSSISFSSKFPTTVSSSLSFVSNLNTLSTVSITGSSTALGSVSFANTTFTSGYGSSTYPSSGTYSWLCPSGVTSVSVVCVGAGGTGGTSNLGSQGGAGGGGGGLGYYNNYSVTAGNTYTVFVGDPLNSTLSQRNSYFVSSGTVQGSGGGNGGGVGSTGGAGGSHVGTGGGNGGAGGNSNNAYNVPGGGGGAGGYSGNGGLGGTGPSTGSSSIFGYGNNSASGSGGGGGGASGNVYWGGAAGGGVNVIGQGSDGLGGSGGTTSQPSTSGSYGTSPNYTPYNNSSGGQSGDSAGGGGGGGQTAFGCCCGYSYSYAQPGGYGGTGIVRIIWPGSARTFPSTNTGAP